MRTNFIRTPTAGRPASRPIRHGARDGHRRALKARAAAVVAGLFAAAASGARAEPVTYTVSGALAGTFNGVAFTNEGFTFSLVGDTNQIVVSGNYSNLDPFQSSTVTLNGIGTYKVLIPMSLGVIADTGGSEIALDEYEPATRSVFLLGTGADVDIGDSFGPVGSAPFVEVIGDVIPTSGGPLQFARVEGTGPTFTLSGSAVPEPPSWTLMLSGLGVAVAALRNRGRAAKVETGTGAVAGG